MAYDEDLANRIRELLAAERAVEEKPMFGGLAFLINGNMAVAASGRGGLMVRVPSEDTAAVLAGKHVEPMIMAGRETPWLGPRRQHRAANGPSTAQLGRPRRRLRTILAAEMIRFAAGPAGQSSRDGDQ